MKSLTLLLLASLIAVACELTGSVDVRLNCPLPIPVVTDSTATGSFNGACPYYVRDGDTLRLVQPLVP